MPMWLGIQHCKIVFPNMHLIWQVKGTMAEHKTFVFIADEAK